MSTQMQLLVALWIAPITLESTVEFDHNGKRVLVSEFFNEDDPHMDHSVGQRVGITWHEGWEVVLNDEDNQ